MRVFILSMLCLGCLAALDQSGAESALPPDAEKAISRYEADVAKLKVDLVKTLRKAQEAATKKGDLEGALAIKTKIGVVEGKSLEGAAPEKIDENPVGKRPVGAFKDETDRKFVVIYSEPNFKGTKVKIRVPTATTDAWQINFPNDALHSIQVPKGAIVNLYTANLGGGAKFVVTESLAEIEGEAIGMTSLSVEQAARE